MSETGRWEYKVTSVNRFWYTKDADVEARLNELGQDGWEVVSVVSMANTNRVMIVAKRPLTLTERRRRSVPR